MTQPLSQQNTQLPDLENFDDINAKNFEDFNKESIFNLLTDYKCNAVCARAFVAIAKDFDIQQYFMQSEDVSDEDKKKALFKAVRAVKKLRKLDKLFSSIKEDDYRECIQEANKEWAATKPKKVKKEKVVPKCFK